VGICYRPRDLKDQKDKTLYRWIGAARFSQALVLTGDFNHPNICWRNNRVGHKKSRRFLDCVDDNFLLQMTEKSTRRGAMLDLVLTKTVELLGSVKLRGTLAAVTMKWWSSRSLGQ